MRKDGDEPVGNMRFRVEVEGLPGTGAFEVAFPEARIVREAGKSRRIQVAQYGTLILKRGVTRSGDWYNWWDDARRRRGTATRSVAVVLLDRTGAAVVRWTFKEALPCAYHVSNLNALGNEPLLETLELTVGGYEAAFG